MSLNRRIGKIVDKLKNKEELTNQEVNLGLSIIFKLTFEAHREEWAKKIAFKNGRWRQDVYDDYMTDDPDDKLITLEIPNLFTWKEESKKFHELLDREIEYICGGCKFKIMRQPESRKDCPLCNAPYDYDPRKIFNEMELKHTNLDEENW